MLVNAQRYKHCTARVSRVAKEPAVAATLHVAKVVQGPVVQFVSETRQESKPYLVVARAPKPIMIAATRETRAPGCVYFVTERLNLSLCIRWGIT
jgi:hypothetical protein